MKDELRFTYLPAYAEFLSVNKINEFTIEQLKLIKELEVPLFKYFSNFSDEQLISSGLKRTELFLKSFSENKVHEYIEVSIQDWLANQTPLLSRESLLPEDITLISYIRRRLFRYFLPLYTIDNDMSLKIMEEIDRYTVAIDTLYFKKLMELQHRLYEQAQSLAQLGNWILDLKTNKLLWSAELFKIYGLKPISDAHNYNLKEFNHPDDDTLVDEQTEYTLKTLKPNDFYYRIILKDGTEKYLHAKCEVELNENGEPVKMFGTLQDVTEQKLSEKRSAHSAVELEQKNKRLEQANKELESFSYIASHDLQEPLRKIQAFSNRILQKEHATLSDWGKDVFSKIISAANRMQKLIEALLDFSRLDKSQEAFVKTDLNTLMTEVKNNLVEVIETKHATIEIGKLPNMNVIPFHFQQLFSNLLSNALKYNKPDTDPFITVTSEIVIDTNIRDIPFSEGKKYYHFRVSDNGIGFDPQYAEKIFELFQRLHGKAEYEGTGIGLAICKKIVDNHHGFITAEGNLGEGARFNMYFPIENN